MDRPWDRERGMTDAEYARLIARRGKQTWTSDDERRLRERVARMEGMKRG